MARIGDIIDGKYEVLREIGRGGMSIVYLAMDRRLNKQWAIKEFRKDKDDANKQAALKALLAEANLMKKLDHPTLPRIVDIIDETGTVYVVMDYIEGESLNKVLDAYGAQPQERVIEWAKQISEVLDYLHTQNPPVIYRDMKPANIMLKPDGTVRLIDFGIAREYKEGKAGDTEAIGTRGYAAPEQFGGRGQTDARTDIYSFGVTLYHLVTGKNPAEPPYEIYPIRHWNPNLSGGLEWLIQKCTQLNPNDRFQSCAEVSYVLDNLDQFETKFKKKKRLYIGMFITSLLLSVTFAVLGVFGVLQRKSETDSLYAEALKNEDYMSAVEYYPEKAEVYEGVLDKYEAKFVVAGNEEAYLELAEYNELYSVFTNAGKLTDEEYIDLCFRYATLVYEHYGSDDGSINTLDAAGDIFGNVYVKYLEAGKEGLSEAEASRARTLCLLSILMRQNGWLSKGQINLSAIDQQRIDVIGGINTTDHRQFGHDIISLINEEIRDIGGKYATIYSCLQLTSSIWQIGDEICAEGNVEQGKDLVEILNNIVVVAKDKNRTKKYDDMVDGYENSKGENVLGIVGYSNAAKYTIALQTGYEEE